MLRKNLKTSRILRLYQELCGASLVEWGHKQFCDTLVMGLLQHSYRKIAQRLCSFYVFHKKILEISLVKFPRRVKERMCSCTVEPLHEKQSQPITRLPRQPLPHKKCAGSSGPLESTPDALEI